jgi:hypothetical protein
LLAAGLGRRGLLGDDLAWGLVLAQALEGGVAQQAVAGPAAILHLRDKAWLDPAHVRSLGRLDAFERRLRARERLELLAQAARDAAAETGADATAVAQGLAVEDAHEQRADATGVALARRVAADHELVAPAALGLDPGLAAPELYGASMRFETMPSSAMRQADFHTASPGDAKCSTWRSRASGSRASRDESFFLRSASDRLRRSLPPAASRSKTK